jgi:hypothetical protein
VDAVALFRAEAGTSPSGTGSFSYFTNFLLLVDNLALAKQVRILDMMPALVPGAFLRAVSGSSVPGNGEISGRTSLTVAFAMMRRGAAMGHT